MSTVMTRGYGSISVTAQHREDIRRHQTMGTYTLPLFLKDIRQQNPRLVTAKTLSMHIMCLQFSDELRVNGKVITRDELMQLLRENLDNKEDRKVLDSGVVELLGLKVKK